MIPHLLTCLLAAGISPRPETRARSQALPRPPGAVRSRTAACGRLRRSPRRRPLCRERAGRVESPGWVWAGIHLQVGDVQLHPFGAVQLHLLSATSESETCSSLRLDAARSREPRSTHDSSPMSVWCTCGAAVQRCSGAAVQRCSGAAVRMKGCGGAGRTQTSPNLEATAGRASNPITCETQGRDCDVRVGTRGKMRVRARAEVRGGEAKEEGEGAPALSSRRRPTAALPARRARSLPRR